MGTLTRKPSNRPRATGTSRLAEWLGGVFVMLLLAIGIVFSVQPAWSFADSVYNNHKIHELGYETKYGLWEQLPIPVKYRVNGIHATALYNGDVLVMAGSGNDQASFNAGTFKTLLLNPYNLTWKLIPTPWDLFCAGHIQLPDGNLLIAGGTARYEVLKPVYSGGSMTVTNWDQSQGITLSKGTMFADKSGVLVRSQFAVTVPAAKAITDAVGNVTVTPGTANVWVNGVAKGQGSVVKLTQQYQVVGQVFARALYGIGTPMTLQKQDFQGLNDAYVYNVAQSRFIKVDSMRYARWYPTLTEMGNGMVMATSGLDGAGQVVNQSEWFDPSTNSWSNGPVRGFPTYPSNYLLKAGTLFFTGSSAGYGPNNAAWRTPGVWNPYTNQFSPIPGMKDPQDLETSASIMVGPAQNQTFMVIGGGGVGDSDQATARTAIINMNRAHPHWVAGPSLPQPTRYVIAVGLPQDDILMTGGSGGYRGDHGSDNRMTEMYDPNTGTLMQMAGAITGRDYHSGGLLLQNGAVLTLGGNPLHGDAADKTGQVFNQTIDLYLPPYMFSPNRPVITSAPKQASYGGRYTMTVNQPGQLSYLRLIRAGNYTHVTDVNARSVAIPYARLANGKVRITIPRNSNLAPPGYYMLFAINTKGIPSEATWVKIS